MDSVRSREGDDQASLRDGHGPLRSPPPDVIDDLERLRRADGFRFANELRAWIDVEDGQVVGWGHAGRGHIGSTTVQLGPKAVVFPAVAFPDLQPEPEVSQTAVRFVQTAGGRTGVPAPRRVRRPPFVQVVWRGRRWP